MGPGEEDPMRGLTPQSGDPRAPDRRDIMQNSLMSFHVPGSAPGSGLETSRKPCPSPAPHQSYFLHQTAHFPWHSLPPFMPTLDQPFTLAAFQLWSLYFPTMMLFPFCMPRPLGTSKIPPRPALPTVQGFPGSHLLKEEAI